MFMAAQFRAADGRPSHLIAMYYAYILESITKPDEFYRGHTDDLKRRVAEHNTGKCSHTSKFKPWKVKFYAAFETQAQAQAFEKYLKSGSGHAFAKRHLLASEDLVGFRLQVNCFCEELN